MAYTRVWVNNTPPGAQAANTADDELRNLRVDVEERMTTLVTGWNTATPSDPIVAKPEILGNVNNKAQNLHHSSFEPSLYFDISANSNSVIRTDLYVESVSGPPTLYAPLIVPVGCTITTVSFAINRNGGSNITASFVYNDFSAAPGTTVIGSVSTTANGIQIINIGAGLPHVVTGNRFYYLKVVMLSSISSRLYGAQVLYNTPDCRNTL